MLEQKDPKIESCIGISMKLGQSTKPFIELKIGDLVHPSLKEYLFLPDSIPDLIKALQLWVTLDDICNDSPYELVFKSCGGVIQIKL